MGINAVGSSGMTPSDKEGVHQKVLVGLQDALNIYQKILVDYKNGDQSAMQQDYKKLHDKMNDVLKIVPQDPNAQLNPGGGGDGLVIDMCRQFEGISETNPLGTPNLSFIILMIRDLDSLPPDQQTPKIQALTAVNSIASMTEQVIYCVSPDTYVDQASYMEYNFATSPSLQDYQNCPETRELIKQLGLVRTAARTDFGGVLSAVDALRSVILSS